eukprot:jgi/Tetstr1/444054/TSEL_031992.t1
MAALFVALDEFLPHVPNANQDFTPYLARARIHAEHAIDKAFRLRQAFMWRLNEIKRVHGDQSRLSQFAEFCHDSEDISPLEATIATAIQDVAWFGEPGHIGAKS